MQNQQRFLQGSMMNQELAIIVATKDRPTELRRLLDSISAQGIMPLQVVVVDGGLVPVEDLVKEFPGMPITNIRKTPASLTAQRNAGIRALRPDASLVAFFDDDLVLEKDSIKNMLAFWANSGPEVMGAVFNNIEDAHKKPTFLERFFMVNSPTPGRIMASGFQSKICSLGEDAPVQWLGGYAMVYRRHIFDQFMFDEWFSGYARYEDVDFSYTVSKRYKLFVVADATVRHLNRLEDVFFSHKLGRMEVINRVYFVKKHKELSLILCYWALFGLFLNNILKGCLMMDMRHLKRATGNLSGFLRLAIYPRDPYR